MTEMDHFPYTRRMMTVCLKFSPNRSYQWNCICISTNVGVTCFQSEHNFILNRMLPNNCGNKSQWKVYENQATITTRFSPKIHVLHLLSFINQCTRQIKFNLISHTFSISFVLESTIEQWESGWEHSEREQFKKRDCCYHRENYRKSHTE